MKNKKVKKYAEELRAEGHVAFVYRGDFYHIFESCNGGYNVDVYDAYDVLNGSEDGGLCTGTAEDAIEFMFPSRARDAL